MTVGNVNVCSSRGGACCVTVIDSSQRLTPDSDTLGSSVAPAVCLTLAAAHQMSVRT